MHGLERILHAVNRDLTEVTEAAVDFLLAARNSEGLWSDFRLTNGGRWPGPTTAEDWVSGYVGSRVAWHPRGRTAALQAWTTLRHRARAGTGGWGYNSTVPADSDSTVWVLRLAQVIGAQPDDVQRAGRAFLDSCRGPDGLLCTYGDPSELLTLLRAPETTGLQGWRQQHVCVSAAAAHLPGIVSPDALTHAQLPDGRWSSYWWATDTYATALAVEALGPGPATEHAARWAHRQLDLCASQMSAFDLANLVSVIAIGANRRAEAFPLLLVQMHGDGSWGPSAPLVVPHPDRAGVVIDTSLDAQRVFTTATALHALHLVSSVTQSA